MEARFEVVTTYDVAIVCAIGSNIAKPGILAKAARALADEKINILSVSQTTRQTNMQFTMERSHFVAAQRALHRALCEEYPHSRGPEVAGQASGVTATSRIAQHPSSARCLSDATGSVDRTPPKMKTAIAPKGDGGI